MRAGGVKGSFISGAADNDPAGGNRAGGPTTVIESFIHSLA